MANNGQSVVQDVDQMLAHEERKLRDELNRILKARDALGKRRGRKPSLTTKG